MKVYVITFSFENFQDLTCIEKAESSGEALRSITSVWQPPAEITNVAIKPVELFQLNIEDRS